MRHQKALEHIRSNGSNPYDQKAVRQSANAKPCITMAAGNRKFFSKQDQEYENVKDHCYI